MLRMYTRSEAEGDFPEASAAEDSGLGGLLGDVESGGRPVVAVHAAEAARSGFVDWLLPTLRQDRVRPVLVSAAGDEEIGLAALMDQVVGGDCANQIERLERCHAALTTLAPGETRIALVIEDAHRLSDQCFRYLELVTSVTRSSGTALLIILVGSPAIWDRLPRTGTLAVGNVACCLNLDDPAVFGEPEVACASTEPVGGAPGVVEMERMVPALILPVRATPRRGWFAWAACAGSFAMAGGFAAGLYLDRPLMSRRLLPRVMMTQASPVGVPPAAGADVPRSDVAVAPAGVEPETGKLQEARVAEAERTAEIAVVVPVTAPPAGDATAGASDAASLAANVTSPPAAAEAVEAAVSVGSPDVPPAASAVAVVVPATPVAVTPPVPVVVSASVASPPISPGVVAALLTRGDTLLATGDVTAARLMYRRAADARSVAGTVAMGMTFDPRVLAQIRVQGLAADPQLAAMWYQRAAGLGSSEAVRLLRQLGNEDAERTGLNVSATHRSGPGR